MTLALILLCLAVLVCDLLYRRVPNSLLLAAVLLQASVLLVLGRGAGGLSAAQALLGCAIGLLAFLPLYLLRAMGAGDVKFFAVLGLLLGAAPLLPIWIVGSVLTLFHVLVLQAARHLPPLQVATAQIGRHPLYRRVRALRGERAGIPYAAWLALATLLVAIRP